MKPIQTLLFINFLTAFFCIQVFAQQPAYTFKHFVNYHDTNTFKISMIPKDGKGQFYLLSEPEIWDTDDHNTTHIRGGGKTYLLGMEGHFKNYKKNGLLTVFLIDSADNTKHYKIWEQTYVNDKLNGEWRTYNLKGTLVRVENYKEDSLFGISKDFHIDGEKVLEEREYFGNRSKYKIRTFYMSGKVEHEQSFEKGVPHGYAKVYYENGQLKEFVEVKEGMPYGKANRYYETGTLMEEAFVVNGQFVGKRKYFYPSGQLWIEQFYKEGKPWNIIGNYDEKGMKRNAGTLKEGNGTIILYNEDGKVREIVTFVKGIQQ